MSADVLTRTRMILDLPMDVQMAIRLRAVKDSITTGDVVRQAIVAKYAKDYEEAQSELAQKQALPDAKSRRRSVRQ